MSEIPAPQDPEQPSPAPAAPPEPPTPPPAQSKLDWRLVVVICLAVLFLIAIYANKKWISKPPAEPAPQESASREGPAPSGPALTPTQRYALMLHVREMEIQGEMFTAGGKTFLVAMPAVPAAPKENGQASDGMTPGTLFDVTKLAEGVKPEMLQRRMIFGPNRQEQALFMDMFPPLGVDSHLEMVLKPAAEVTMDVLPDRIPVIGVKVGAEARAYPVKFMNYHDVINDTLGGEPIVVVWSAPASAPSALYRDQLTFGSAGLVYQGAIVMYSKDTDSAADGKTIEKFSLWSPTLHLCIAGERAGARLRPIQAELVTWKTWKTINPDTTVLAGTKPVQPFNYDGTMAVPADYLNPQNPVLPHPVYGLDVEKNPFFPKASVFGITDSQGKAAKAYLPALLREKPGPFEDTVGDRKLTLQFNPDTLILSAKDADGNPVLTEAMFWIAWLGAHPNTEVWQADRLRALREGQVSPAPAGTSAPATTAAPEATSAPGP
ncbi:MAG: DUF3179 domain-containing (seleno)protein [Candidatus Brocadiia bacterium]